MLNTSDDPCSARLASRNLLQCFSDICHLQRPAVCSPQVAWLSTALRLNSAHSLVARPMVVIVSSVNCELEFPLITYARSRTTGALTSSRAPRVSRFRAPVPTAQYRKAQARTPCQSRCRVACPGKDLRIVDAVTCLSPARWHHPVEAMPHPQATTVVSLCHVIFGVHYSVRM